jgi:diguanylate cyclase (GGDEF)-like protein
VLSRFALLAARLGHARARSLLLFGGLFIGIIFAVAMTWFIVTLRHTEIKDAVREMRNVALMLSEQDDRLLQSVDLVQLALLEHMRQLGIDSPRKFERMMATEAAHRDLRDRVAGLSYIGSLSLHNLRGDLLNFSRTWPPPPINVADRDFFRVMSASDGLLTFISEPIRSVTTGKWTIYLSRRFEAVDGQLIGIVLSTIEIDYFEQSYAQLPLSGGGSYTLYRRDGMLLARYPHVDPLIGKAFAATMNFNRMLGALNGGVSQFKSMLDGQERLVVPHTFAHFPLLIVVSDTVETILGRWREEAQMLAATTALLEFVLAGTILLSVRHLRGYEQLHAAETARERAEANLALGEERQRAAQVLHAHEHRFDTALHNMLQGLLMIGQSGELVVVNRRFNEVFDMPDGVLVPGMTYQEVTERVVEFGNVCAEDMREARGRRATLLERNERATVTWELADGRTFNVTHQPMEAGWLATFEDISARCAAEARMVHLAQHDALTDLPNRVLFHAKLQEALALARRGHKIALLCFDLDQFKAVNDTLGHPIGDAVLQAVSERLCRGTRETDTVARLGSDEYAIIQTAIVKPTETTDFATRLLHLLSTPFEVAGHNITIGTSIGIAFAPEDGLDADQLLRCADLALSRAKLDGRGVYRLFQAEMDAQMQERRLLELDLRQALEVGQFEVFYQPLVDLRVGAVTGVEALLRWRHPVRGLVSPANFIPLAEEIGLIVPIGEWVLREACRTVASWQGGMRVAVNLSPVQFQSRTLVATVARALRDAYMPAGRLELEITETVMLQDTDATLATLAQLRDLGVRIAMDDFGTGYSSLSYLRRFPFDRIKIDQSFVRDINSKRDCGAIIRAVTGLSRELGIATTAEGVETQAQLDALVSAGCTEFQGYLFSPAVTGGAVAGLRCSIAEMLRPALAELEA